MFVCAECGSRSEQAGPCHRDGAPRRETDDAFLGMEVGPYRLARLLGRGGMGRVYLGIQPAVGGRVAIKLLSDDACEKPSLIERFFTEARAVNLINHEGIVRVFDFTQTPTGRPAIVMELVDGRTLREIIRAGKPPLGGLIQVMIEVLSALSAAHDIGIVHRDLKPDNIIVTPSGRAKVLDFGIAKLDAELPGAGPSTRSGAMLGTPHYMSPEQLGRGTVDGRSDVYAAGVVLFEAITGEKPFEGLGHFDLLIAQVEKPPPSPRALRPELPEALANVVLRALAKPRSERFASASEMANALHAASAELAAEDWRSLAPRGRALTRPSAPPASIPPPTMPTGPIEPPAPAARKAAPYDATDRADAGDAPRGSSTARRAGSEPSPPPLGPPEPRTDRAAPVPSRRAAADRRAGNAPGTDSPDPEARGATGSQQRRQAPTVRVSARPRSRLLVPVIAACAGGLVVALVGRMLAPGAPPPGQAPAVAVTVEGPPRTAVGSADGHTPPARSPVAEPPSPPVDVPPTPLPEPTGQTEPTGQAPPPAPTTARLTTPSPGRPAPTHTQRSPSPAAPTAGRSTGRPSGESTAPPLPAAPSDAPGGSAASAAIAAAILARGDAHARVRPIDFDPHRFDPSAYLPKARAVARELLPDAELTMLLFPAVKSDGFIDLDYLSYENVSYMFRSPTRSQRRPEVPVNAPLPPDCGVLVTVTQTDVIAKLGSHGCAYDLVAAPRCTTHEVWRAALASGAPDHRLAHLAWMHASMPGTSRPQWYFDSVTPGESGGIRGYYEDCADAASPATSVTP